MNAAPREYPKLPELLGVALVAFTVLIQSYSFLFKLVPILVFLMLWGAYVYYKKTFMLRLTPDLLFALAFPLLCSYSALWSDAGVHSLYAGVGMCAMVCCTVIMNRLVTGEVYAKGLSVGITITMLVMLVCGLYGRGLFGSKNVAGFIAEVGVYVSFLLMLSKISFRNKLVYGAVPLAINAACLYLSHSASSLASLGAAFCVYAAVWILCRVSKPYRKLMLAAGVFACLTVAVFVAAMGSDVSQPFLKALGKDSTLTGRTYLWSEGIRNGLKRPLLGYGYYAFWMTDRPEAEQYWRKFEIFNRSGFHFHNLYIQTFVDMGVVGLVLIVCLIFYGIFKSLRMAMRHDLDLEISIALGLSVMFLIRGFVEVDIFGPFGFGPLIYYPIIPRLAAHGKALAAGITNGLDDKGVSS